MRMPALAVLLSVSVAGGAAAQEFVAPKGTCVEYRMIDSSTLELRNPCVDPVLRSLADDENRKSLQTYFQERARVAAATRPEDRRLSTPCPELSLHEPPAAGPSTPPAPWDPCAWPTPPARGNALRLSPNTLPGLRSLARGRQHLPLVLDPSRAGTVLPPGDSSHPGPPDTARIQLPIPGVGQARFIRPSSAWNRGCSRRGANRKEPLTP